MLNDVDTNVMNLLLKHIYTGFTEFNAETCLNLLPYANQVINNLKFLLNSSVSFA